MNKSIHLYIKGNSWIAAFMIDGSPDKEITALFGTHHLPMAFTASASPATVLQEVQALNPDSVITIS